MQLSHNLKAEETVDLRTVFGLKSINLQYALRGFDKALQFYLQLVVLLF